MKIKKSTIVLLAALFATALLIRYALRDISLDVNLLLEGLEKIPGIVLEDVELEREIEGDLWHVSVPWAERRGGETRVRSLEIRRWLASGKEWYFKSAEGSFAEEEGRATLTRLLGTMETGTRVLNLESPTLLWTEGEKDFFFPDGVTVYDTEFILRADVASLDEDGVILLDRGGNIRWTKNLQEDF